MYSILSTAKCQHGRATLDDLIVAILTTEPDYGLLKKHFCDRAYTIVKMVEVSMKCVAISTYFQMCWFFRSVLWCILDTST